MRAWATTIAVVGSVVVAAAQETQTGRRAFTPLQNPVFEIGVRTYEANGAMSGSAGDGSSEGEFQSYVWTTPSLCGLGASNEEPSNITGHGWFVKGAITSRSGDQATIRIDWRRMWDTGRRIADGASGTKTVTLRSGERLELDRVVPAGASSCGASEAKLEAALVSPSAWRLTTSQSWPVIDGALTYGGRGAGRGGGAAAAGRGAGTTTTSRGGGAGTTTGTTAGTTTGTTQGTARGGGRGAFQLTTFRYASTPIGSYDAELWLVHRRPDGTETVQQQNLRFSGNAFEAKFPPVIVQSPRVAISVDVTAKLQAFVGNPPAADSTNWQYVRLTGLLSGGAASDPNAKAEPARVMLTIARRARATGNPTIDTSGSSAMALDMPKPEDVLSFEFPPLQKATEDLLKGHVFSLRVRIIANK